MFIADVDTRILQVFTEAYADVEREFEQVFATLFPGGEGRLLPPTPTTCSPPVSRWRPARPARRRSAFIALRWREVTDRRGDAGGHLPRPPLAVLCDGRGRGRLDDSNLRRLLTFSNSCARNPS